VIALQTRWLRGSFPLPAPPSLSPVKDLFLLPVWFDALVNRRIDWRAIACLSARSPGSASPGSRAGCAAVSAGSVIGTGRIRDSGQVSEAHDQSHLPGEALCGS